MRSIAIIGLVLGLASLAPAQDWIRLSDGSRVQGDIIYETKDRIDIIDLVGVRHQFSRDDVDKFSRGKALHKTIAARLKEINDADPDALFALAKEALAKKSTKADGERLLRRVLALDDTYEGPRELLGHVQALDRWFADQKSADQALAETYKAQGFVKFKGGWAAPDQVDEIKANPADFMVDQGRWLPLAEVMMSRGNVEFRGQWYDAAEARYVHFAGLIEKDCKMIMEGAQVGTVVVIHHKGRDHARALAMQLMKARNWFAKTYEKREAAETPLCLEVVVAKKSEWLGFIESAGPELTTPKHDSGKSRGETMGISWNDYLGGIVHDETPTMGLPGLAAMGAGAVENTEASRMINALGFALMAKVPEDKTRQIPWWLLTASSIHAEISATGMTIVSQATDESDYDRSGSNDVHGNHGADHKELRAKLKETLKHRRISMRTLFFARGVQLDHETDQYGVVLLQWFLEEHREKLLAYIHGAAKGSEDKTFEHYFKMSFEEAEKLFLAWI